MSDDPGHPDLTPGDIAERGREEVGEDVCPDCRGTGRQGERECPTCRGRGKITEAVGGG